MKILFIVKSKVMENLGVMYLAAVAKKAGHEISIVDINDASFAARVWKPDILAYSVMTGDQERMKDLNYSIRHNMPSRQKQPRSIFGGPHITFFPEDFPIGENIDATFHGEAESEFTLWLAGRSGEASIFPDIDSIPEPDRTDFPGMRIRDFITSRGCPYNCFIGSTPVRTMDGIFPIASLVGQEGVKVLSRDPVTQEPLYANAINIALIKKNAELVKVNFDDGSHIICTPDHRFKVFKSKNQYIQEGEWDVEAKDLKPKQQVRAVRFEVNKKGRVNVSTRRDIVVPHAKIVMEAMIGRQLISGERVHHKDFNPANDSPDNLVLTTNESHIPNCHPEVAERMRESNPIHGMTEEWLSEHGKRNFSGRKQSLPERMMRRETQLGAKNSNWKGGYAAAAQNRPSRIVNHKVKSVDTLRYKEDVYCLEVPGIHWFYVNDVLCENCSYCYNARWSQLYPGEPVRTRQVQDVIAEINAVSPEFVYFQDSCFGVNMNWLREFSHAYRREINIPFHCHLRPSQVTEERVLLLSDARCVSVRIALETASKKLLKLLNREKTDLDQVKDAVRMLKKWNIRLMIQNMIGLPTGTIQDDLQTLEFNIRCRPTYGWVSIFQPYPGTELGDWCKKDGWYKGDYSEISDSFFDGSVLEFDDVYKEQLKYLQKIWALAIECQVMPQEGELTLEYFPKLVHRIMRAMGDRRMYPGVM